MRTRLTSIAFAFVLLHGFANLARAQGCSEPNSVCNEFWAGFKTIFIGRVVEVVPYRQPQRRASRRARPGGLTPRSVVRFVVEKSYRKDKAQRLEVEVLGNSQIRPLVFEKGQRYLVFADRALFDTRLSVSTCGRTALVANARQDIDYLESVFELNPVTDILNYRDGPVRQVSILQGKAISLPKPPYPASAKAAGASGPVAVLILLDEAGKVIRVKSLCGNPQLMVAAETAAWQARFTPTKLSGEPIKVSTIITYHFVLQ